MCREIEADDICGLTIITSRQQMCSALQPRYRNMCVAILVYFAVVIQGCKWPTVDETKERHLDDVTRNFDLIVRLRNPAFVVIQRRKRWHKNLGEVNVQHATSQA